MTYDIVLTEKDGKFIARVCQWPAISAESDTEDKALCKVQSYLTSLLAGGRIVQLEVLEVDIKPEGHPWQQFARMFADDPDWEAFQASIQKYRENMDRASHED